MKTNNYNPWNKGLTKETNSKLKNIGEKMSRAKKGKNLNSLGHDMNTCSCCMCKAYRGELKGKNSYTYGMHHTKEAKKKMSKVHKGVKYSDEINKRKGKSGKENAAFKDGYTVLLVDHRKEKKEYCDFCNSTCNLDIHHEPHINRDNFKEWAGTLFTLCRSCHLKFHRNRIKEEK